MVGGTCEALRRTLILVVSNHVDKLNDCIVIVFGDDNGVVVM